MQQHRPERGLVLRLAVAGHVCLVHGAVSRGAGHVVTLPHSPSYHFSVSPYCFCVLLGFRDLGSPSLSHFVSIFWKQREVDHDGGDIGHEYK